MKNTDVVAIILQLLNKRYVLTRNLTFRKVYSLIRAGFYSLTGFWRPDYPPFLKIETTLKCQLRCPTCWHGAVAKAEKVGLDKHSGDMDLETFKRCIDEVKRDAIAISLYNLGEPLLTKNFVEMIGYASKSRINTYFTTNFSLPLSDEYLKQILQSGLTLMIVALDGFSQTAYSQTRRNGNIELVKDNLARLCRIKRDLGLKFPLIQIQSLIFEHNTHEKDSVIQFCQHVGVDILRFSDGSLITPGSRAARNRLSEDSLFPKCLWPYFNLIVRFNGDAVPCCLYRNEQHLLASMTPLSLGNLSSKSVREIFASEELDAVRQFVRKPSAVADPSASFAKYCVGCPIVYH